MLEVLVMKLPHSEHWTLPGVSQAPYLAHLTQGLDTSHPQSLAGMVIV